MKRKSKKIKGATATNDQWDKWKKLGEVFSPQVYLNESKARCDSYLEFLKLPNNYKSKKEYLENKRNIVQINLNDSDTKKRKKRHIQMRLECVKISLEIDRCISIINPKLSKKFTLEDFNEIFMDVFELGYKLRKLDEIILFLFRHKGRPSVSTKDNIKLKIEDITNRYLSDKSIKINKRKEWTSVWDYAHENQIELGIKSCPKMTINDMGNETKLDFLRYKSQIVGMDTFGRYCRPVLKNYK